MLRRIEFRTVGRLCDQPDVFRDLQCPRLVPSGAVYQHYDEVVTEIAETSSRKMFMASVLARGRIRAVIFPKVIHTAANTYRKTLTPAAALLVSLQEEPMQVDGC